MRSYTKTDSLTIFSPCCFLQCLTTAEWCKLNSRSNHNSNNSSSNSKEAMEICKPISRIYSLTCCRIHNKDTKTLNKTPPFVWLGLVIGTLFRLVVITYNVPVRAWRIIYFKQGLCWWVKNPFGLKRKWIGNLAGFIIKIWKIQKYKYLNKVEIHTKTIETNVI